MLPILLLVIAADPAPLLAVAPTLDRGEVRTGPPLLFAFELHNPGPGPLLLRGADAGCNCARPALSAATLPPGGRATLTLTVNTLTPAAGPNRWPVRVRYADAPGGPDQTMTVVAAATLVREVAVHPPGLAVSTAGGATLPLTVTDRRPAPLRVLAATATSPHLTAVVNPGASGPDGWSQAVTLTVSPALPPGRHVETLVLTTSDPAVPELRVPVTVDKRPPQEVRAVPAALDLPAGGSGRVLLRRLNGQPLRAGTVTSDHPGVTAEAEGAGPTVTLRVTLGPAAGPAGEATVRVKLDDPAGREVRVPVSWGGR